MEKNLENDKAIAKAVLSVIQYLCLATPATIFLLEENAMPLTIVGIGFLVAALVIMGIEYMKKRL